MTYHEGEKPFYTDDGRRRSGKHLLDKTGRELPGIGVVSNELHLLDVPEVKATHMLGSGYAALAMALQYHGYGVSPDDFYTQVHGREYDSSLSDQPAIPDLRTFGHIASEMTNGDLVADLWSEPRYLNAAHRLEESGHSALTPFDFLNRHLLKWEVPVIVNSGSRNSVIVGVDLSGAEDHYRVFENRYGTSKPMSRRDFNDGWRVNEGSVYPINTSYLMLALRKPLKKGS